MRKGERSRTRCEDGGMYRGRRNPARGSRNEQAQMKGMSMVGDEGLDEEGEAPNATKGASWKAKEARAAINTTSTVHTMAMSESHEVLGGRGGAESISLIMSTM